MKALMVAVLLSAFLPAPVSAACHPEPVGPNTPTGVAGCVIYGEGTASHWQGPGVARNDCVYPWADCTTIRITSLDTGRSITVRPTMFCDCYTGTSDQRIVDLDPAAVSALGLSWSRGLYPVRVEPVVPEQRIGTPLVGMPDTAMEAR